MNIGESIKAIRERAGKTQREVANDLYVSVALLSAIETNIKQPSLNVALALARYFKVSVETLIGVESEER